MPRRPTVTRSGLRRAAALFRHATLPFVRRHRVQFGLLVVTIALGVATILATRMLVDSATGSVEAAVASASGAADFRVANGFAGVPEHLLERIRALEEVEDAQAILIDQAVVAGKPVNLIGVDLLGGDPLHLDVNLRSRESFEVCQDSDFLVRPNAVAISERLAEQWGVAVCSTLPAAVRTGSTELFVAGVFRSRSSSTAVETHAVVLDLPRAQILTGRSEIVDAIDIRLEPRSSGSSAASARIQDLVSPYATASSPEYQVNEIRKMLFNIRLILGVAGSLAIVVGALIIVNVMSMSASRRKPVFDMMLSLGATRFSLRALGLAEALVLGLGASLLGLVVGCGIAMGAGSLFQGAIAALYLPLQTSTLELDPGTFGWALSCGVFLTVVAASVPMRSILELDSGLRVASAARMRAQRAGRGALAGVFLLACGVGFRVFQAGDVDAETLGALVTISASLIFLGAGLLMPLVVRVCKKPVQRLLDRSPWRTVSLGWRTLAADPARSAIVVVSVMAGVSYFLMAVGAVGSLRVGVLSWLKSTHHAEIVVAARGAVGFLPSSRPVAGAVESRLRSIEGVGSVHVTRLVAQPFRDRWAVIVARDEDSLVQPSNYIVRSGNIETRAMELRAGTHALVSETLSLKHAVAAGDVIELRAPRGKLSVTVAAVVVDYNSDLGSIVISKGQYARSWLDESATAFHVRIRDGFDAPQVVDYINRTIGDQFAIEAQPIETVLLAAEEIVDSAFYAAYALVFIAVIVVIASVSSFLLIAASEREPEFQMLREIGATPSQLANLLRAESVILGLIGAVPGCVVGTFLARSLVADTVRIGGGMELAFVLPWGFIGIAVATALIVSLLASVFPVALISRAVYGSGRARA